MSQVYGIFRLFLTAKYTYEKLYLLQPCSSMKKKTI